MHCMSWVFYYWQSKAFLIIPRYFWISQETKSQAIGEPQVPLTGSEFGLHSSHRQREEGVTLSWCGINFTYTVPELQKESKLFLQCSNWHQSKPAMGVPCSRPPAFSSVMVAPGISFSSAHMANINTPPAHASSCFSARFQWPELLKWALLRIGKKMTFLFISNQAATKSLLLSLTHRHTYNQYQCHMVTLTNNNKNSEPTWEKQLGLATYTQLRQTAPNAGELD